MEQNSKISQVEQNTNPQNQTIIMQQPGNRNGIGLTGFIMSITGLFVCWVPVLCWLLLIPSFILSLLGMFRKPRALSIIGLIISGLLILVKLIIKIGFWGGLMSLSML